MSGRILTPLSIWGKKPIDFTPKYEVVEEKQFGDLLLERLYLNGRTTKEGTVKIYLTIVRKIKSATMPAVLLFNDFGADGDTLAIDFARNGYYAISVDLAGECIGRDRYTRYPKDLSYANYLNNPDTSYIEKDVTTTCWYEWGLVGRCVISFLRTLPFISKIGAVALGKASTVLWQLSATTEDISASVFVGNAGWSAYKGIRKFEGKLEPQFSDDMLKFIAGVEPQSFAQHIKAPVLMLSPLISNEYDSDRVHDTVDRISKEVYRAVYYSPEYTNAINEKGYKSMFLFLKKFLLEENTDVDLPDEPEIKCNFANKAIEIEVLVNKKNLKELSLFASEEIVEPSFRAWNKSTNGTEISEGKYLFKYNPYNDSGIVMFYATAEYKDGYVISSNIISRKFNPEEVLEQNLSRIVYSGREKNSESVFISIKDGGLYRFEMNNGSGIYVKDGPMGIQGVYSKGGLKTFKINAKKGKPSIDALLMLDVYAKEDGDLKIALESISDGKPILYSTCVRINGGKVWHNVKIEMNKFKTEDGRLLKSFSNINAMYFYISGEYLINNVLWV